MKPNYGLMVELKPEFQKSIFQKVVNYYKGSIKASKILGIPASSIRGYKNLYFKVVPKYLLNNLVNLNILSIYELESNILTVFDKNDIIRLNLNQGRVIRKEHFKKIRDSIPPFKEIIDIDYLNVEKWFNIYKGLVNSNFRKLEISSEGNFLVLRYNNFTQSGYRDFKVNLPKRIKLDEEFIYFFGLWCGDRSGGKRVGICNQNEGIIQFTDYFLRKYKQTVERVLYITKELSEPKIKYDKKFIIDKEIKGWVLSIHSKNGVFSSFLYYLQSYLEDFLQVLDNKYPFFAGLFDAEGNVSLYNRSVRWGCKNETFIRIYSDFLKKLNLFDRYDGSSLVSYNIENFYNRILSYMKHTNKINGIIFLYKGEGKLPPEYEDILKLLKTTSHKTSQEIAKALKKNKVYSELKLLSDFGFIIYESYPKKFVITEKGLRSLRRS